MQDTDTSYWTIIQPPTMFYNEVRTDASNNSTLHPLGLHVKYLGAAAANWREYFNYVAERLKKSIHHAHAILLNTADMIAAVRAHGVAISETCNYDDILKFHGQELLVSNGVKLAMIAEEDSAQNKVMASLTEMTHKDSRTVRVMTMIALIYLPANLILAFFSTTIVSLPPLKLA
ncbi:unnamed protein product [Parascedosporium putredinis]|uniref:Uncharacterized protein n=1 Tax=Parascedosporium putredinis TaxID=1442378 RepID=A0A9P1H2U5_9PEZI|nr:unnamed protein product [Parascedosporium putredinis]CAI7996327.1 unnamed protein product [Parascedosporium putredinis]